MLLMRRAIRRSDVGEAKEHHMIIMHLLYHFFFKEHK